MHLYTDVLFGEPKISVHYCGQVRVFEEEVAKQKELDRVREEQAKIKKGIDENKIKLLQNLTDYMMIHIELKSLLKGQDEKVGQITKSMEEIKERKEIVKKICSQDELEAIVADEKAKFGLGSEADLALSKDLLVNTGGLDMKSLNEYFKPFGRIDKLAPDSQANTVKLGYTSITDAVKVQKCNSGALVLFQTSPNGCGGRASQTTPEGAVSQLEQKYGRHKPIQTNINQYTYNLFNSELERLLSSFE